MKLEKFMKRLFRRLFYCKHKYMPYQSVQDGRRRRTIWKCTRCGKTKMGL